MTAQELAESYDGKIVKRRGEATAIDFFVLFVAIVVTARVFKPRGVWEVLAIGAAVSGAYYLAMETICGRTVGKFVYRIAVVGDDGGKPSFGAVFIRTLTRIMEVNPVLFGALPAGLIANFSKSHRRLGDMLAGTFVVLSRDLPRITSSPYTGSA